MARLRRDTSTEQELRLRAAKKSPERRPNPREFAVRIRTAIAVAALLPTSLAFAVAPASDDNPSCRVDAERTKTVETEDGMTAEVPVEYCETSIYAHCNGTLDEAGAAKL